MVLAVGKYRLANDISYQVCAEALSIGKTNAIEACMDTITALNAVRNNYIKFLKSLAEKQKAIDSFKDRSVLPNVLVTINGTHIKVKPPPQKHRRLFQSLSKT